MANIRPDQLPAAGTVNPASALVIDDGANVEKATPIQVVDAAIPLASQAEAESGADNAKRVTPLRVKQAIDAQAATIEAVNARVPFTELASTAPGEGSALVGFKQDGVSAVSRTAEEKMRDWVAIEDFGGGTGKTAIENGQALMAALDDGHRRVIFPRDEYNIAGVSFTTAREGFQILANRLVNNSTDGTDMFTISSLVRSSSITAQRIHATSNAGHHFVAQATLAHARITVIELSTASSSKSLFKTDGGAWTNVDFVGNKWLQPTSSTVAAFEHDEDISSFNACSFDIRQHFCSKTQPFYRILNRGASFNYGNTWTDSGYEYGTGGLIHLTGDFGTKIGNLTHFDTDIVDGVLDPDGGLVVGDGIWIGDYTEYTARYPSYPAGAPSGTPAGSYMPKIGGLTRNPKSVLDTGAADIRMGNSRDFRIGVSGSSTGARGFTVDLGPNSGVFEGGPLVTLLGFNTNRHVVYSEETISAKEFIAGTKKLTATSILAVAKAHVTAGGALQAGSAGIASVVNTSTGVYTYTLSSPVSSTLGSVVGAETSQSGREAPVISWTNTATFTVTWRVGGTLTNTAHSVMVLD